MGSVLYSCAFTLKLHTCICLTTSEQYCTVKCLLERDCGELDILAAVARLGVELCFIECGDACPMEELVCSSAGDDLERTLVPATTELTAAAPS